MKEDRLHIQFMEHTVRDAHYMELVCASLFPGDVQAQEEMMQSVTVQMLDVFDLWTRRERRPMPQKYFWAVFQNLCKRHYRQHHERLDQHPPLDPEMEASLADEGPSLHARFNVLIDQLDDCDRALIERYCQAGDYPQLAAQLGISRGHARVIVHRIVVKLRRRRAVTVLLTLTACMAALITVGTARWNHPKTALAEEPQYAHLAECAIPMPNHSADLPDSATFHAGPAHAAPRPHAEASVEEVSVDPIVPAHESCTHRKSRLPSKQLY